MPQIEECAHFSAKRAKYYILRNAIRAMKRNFTLNVRAFETTKEKSNFGAKTCVRMEDGMEVRVDHCVRKLVLLA